VVSATIAALGTTAKRAKTVSNFSKNRVELRIRIEFPEIQADRTAANYPCSATHIGMITDHSHITCIGFFAQ